MFLEGVWMLIHYVWLYKYLLHFSYQLEQSITPKCVVECRDRWLLWLSGMRRKLCLPVLRNG